MDIRKFNLKELEFIVLKSLSSIFEFRNGKIYLDNDFEVEEYEIEEFYNLLQEEVDNFYEEEILKELKVLEES